MAKPETRIVSGTGIGVGGNSEASKRVVDAMRNVVLTAHSAGEIDGKALRPAIHAARQEAKPEARR